MWKPWAIDGTTGQAKLIGFIKPILTLSYKTQLVCFQLIQVKKCCVYYELFSYVRKVSTFTLFRGLSIPKLFSCKP
jgi:hypothetical protein